MQITPPLIARLKSSQGVNIAVHYVIEEHGVWKARKLYKATHLDLVVCSANLSPNANVTAVLINRWKQNGAMIYQQVWTVRLCLIEDFEGSGPGFIGRIYDSALVNDIHHHHDMIFGEPQIAVEIDGVWQQDPLQWQGAHNFNFAWLISNR